MSEFQIESDDAAAEALFNAVQEDTGRSQHTDAGVGAREPEQVESKPEAVDTSDTPSEEAQNAATTTDSFTGLDPNAIPDELKPWYQSMQADYVRKTQAVAEQRKQLEQFGQVDPTELQAAHQLFQNLQDPQYALNFYKQIGGTLSQMGYLEQQALAAQATQAPQQEQVQFSPEDDPEAYFQSKLSELDNRFQTMQQQLSMEKAAAQAEQQRAALAGEIARQEQFIKDSNPHYNDKDIDAIYQMSAWYNGDLMTAQSAYESAMQDRINRLLAGKSSVTDNGPVPTGAAVTADTAPSFGDDLEGAHRAAQEALRNMMQG